MRTRQFAFIRQIRMIRMRSCSCGLTETTAARWRPGHILRMRSLAIALTLAASVSGAQSHEAVSLLGDTLRTVPISATTRARYESQLADAKRAYDRTPTNADSIIWYARRLGYLGRFRESIATYTKGLALQPSNAWLLRHRGHRYISIREFDKAIADLTRAAQLVQGKPDEVEPDGQPNAQNSPIGTLHSNIDYHLALAHYLKGQYARAVPIYQRELAGAQNDDRRVSIAYWYWLALRRLGRDADARAVLVQFSSATRLIENDSYKTLLLLFKGEITPDSALRVAGTDSATVPFVTIGYGVASWLQLNGRAGEAAGLLTRILNGGQWPAFGYVAAEADMARLRRPTVSDSARSRAMRALAAQPVVDGHNDLPWRIREDTVRPMDVDAYNLRKRAPGHTDLARIKQGKLGAQFWSIYIPGEKDDAAYKSKGAVASMPGYSRVQLEQIDIARRVIAKYPEMEWTLKSAQIAPAIARGKIGSLLGLEGGHAIENSLNLLRTYYEMGARYMTLTHNVTLDWADAALDSAKHGGLTEFGREVVREMNRLGMLVDLSHVSPGTMSDALDVTTAPVIFSHSAARALVDHKRNVPDSILARLPKNGGVVMVTFVPGFVSNAVKADEDSAAVSGWRAKRARPRALLTEVADMVDHVKRVAGVNHVGIGSDFDGISEVVIGLEDVSTFPTLFAELARRGWSQADLQKLAGGNVLRALRQAETVAAREQRQRLPSNATIEQLDGIRPVP
jgi:membrane dipeptidase